MNNDNKLESVRTNDNSLNRVSIKNDAKKLNKDKIWEYWKFAWIPIVIELLLGIIFYYLKVNEDSVDLISSLISLALIPMTYAINAYILNIVRGKPVDSMNIFDYYPVFLRVLVISVLTALFVFLWSLLFIIPGIIAAIGYSFVTFIAIDNPDMEATEVLKKSKDLLNGYKMDYFILQLSFLGWIILGAFTFGILYIWLIPYMNYANAIYYDRLLLNHKIEN